MIAYKLTTQDGKTRPGQYNETQWGEGVEHTTPGGVLGECGEGWLHAYHSPGVAAMMNAAHAVIGNPVCWECDADVTWNLGDKLLCTRVKTIRVVAFPKLTLEQHVEIAIRATMAVYDNPAWLTWAQDWLSETDRSTEAAWSAVEVATATARASTIWTSVLAEMAARATARAAARSASWAASCVELVTLAAEAAGAAVASVDGILDLGKIINDVLRGAK